MDPEVHTSSGPTTPQRSRTYGTWTGRLVIGGLVLSNVYLLWAAHRDDRMHAEAPTRSLAIASELNHGNDADLTVQRIFLDPNTTAALGLVEHASFESYSFTASPRARERSIVCEMYVDERLVRSEVLLAARSPCLANESVAIVAKIDPERPTEIAIRASSFATTPAGGNADDFLGIPRTSSRANGLVRFDVADYAEPTSFGGDSLAGVIQREAADAEERIELRRLQWPQSNMQLEIHIIARYLFAPDVASSR